MTIELDIMELEEIRAALQVRMVAVRRHCEKTKSNPAETAMWLATIAMALEKVTNKVEARIKARQNAAPTDGGGV